MDQIQAALKLVTDRMSQKSGSRLNEDMMNNSMSDGTNRTAKTKSTLTGNRKESRQDKFKKMN